MRHLHGLNEGRRWDREASRVFPSPSRPSFVQIQMRQDLTTPGHAEKLCGGRQIAVPCPTAEGRSLTWIVAAEP